jgi:hypothetical protein
VIVVYSPGNRDYHTAFTAPFERSGGSEDENPLPRNLFIAVAVLGLASYGLSFGPVIDGEGATDWYVRFAALAGLSAALGLVAKGHKYPLATAVLAAMGFLDALSSQLLYPNPGWALTVIVVLNAVQAAMAIAALVLGRKADAPKGETAGYEAYVEYYNQAVRNYYGQQASPASPEVAQQGGYGQAAAYGSQTSHRAQRAPQQGEYSEFVSAPGDYGHAPSSAAGPSQSVSPGGLARFGPGQPPASRQEAESEQSAWPPSGP